LGKNTRILVLWISILIFGTTIGDRSIAQSPPNTPSASSENSVEADYAAAFQEMLHDPGNFKKTFHYAQLAEKIGDLEGAIGAYSRLLITIPEHWQIHYELGVLYFRLKSYALSKSYFLASLKNKEMPPVIRKRVARFMDKIGQQSGQHRFSGTLSLGARYQTNVNAGSGSSSGAVGAIQINSNKNDDAYVFGSLDAEYIFDFNKVGGTVWKSNGQIYGAKQIEETEFDLIFIDASSGPRFELGQEIFAGLRAQPRLILEYARLGNSRLYYGLGGGLELEKAFGDDVTTKLTYELRDRSYRDNARRPNSTNLNGINHAIEAEVLYAVTPSVGTNVKLRFDVQNAQETFESNEEISLLVGANLSYAAPFNSTDAPWLSGITVKHARSHYDQPNPGIDPANSRGNKKWFLARRIAVARRGEGSADWPSPGR
jgi:hypothetical protein